MQQICVVIILIFISLSSTTVVKWLPNKSFSLAANFENGKLPCSKETVVFPEKIWESVKFDSDTSISGIIFPKDGEIILAKGVITFGSDKNDNCADNGYTYYIPKALSSWAQPDVWSSSKFNEATPDNQRVPCYNDQVEFPPGAEFSIQLPEVTQYVEDIKIRNTNLNTERFLTYALLSTFGSEQQFILNNVSETGVEVVKKSCALKAGCMCQDFVLEIDCESKYCPTPKCIDPIKPVGHCCKICGGYLILDIDERYNSNDFEAIVAKIVDSFGSNNVVYFINRIPDNKIQLVVVDKGEYDGTSAEVVHDVELDMNGDGFQGVGVISGTSLSKAGLGGKIAVSMFFAVILVMIAIYAYYYKLPDIRNPFLDRSVGVLSRFNRRTDSVVSLTRRDSSATVASLSVGSDTGTSFRNPLYDSKRGRVHVTEPVLEE